MTVAELIADLLELDPAAKVGVLETGSGSWYDLDVVRLRDDEDPCDEPPVVLCVS